MHRPSEMQRIAIENALNYMETLELAVRTGTMTLTAAQEKRAYALARKLAKTLRIKAFNDSGILRTQLVNDHHGFTMPVNDWKLVKRLARDLPDKQVIALRQLKKSARELDHASTAKALVRKGLAEDYGAGANLRITPLGTMVLTQVDRGTR